MIIPWVTGISLFLQLSNSCLIAGITVTNGCAATPRLSLDELPAPGSFSVDYPSRILQAPGEEHYEFNVEGANDVRGKKIENREKATAGVIDLDWKETQAGRRYLPPRRVVESYGPPGVVPIEGGSPLHTPSYSSESWNTPSNVRAKLRGHREEEGNRGSRGREGPKRHEDAPPEDTKPVFELTNDEPPYEVSNDERDYEGPEGNRAREQSTRPNTVTSLGHHRPTDSHEFPRDTSAAAAATSFSTLDWLLTDKSHNSSLHPPPNPIISLILSHYGRYLPGTQRPKVYSYMAVNNIHNNRPFGQYKLSSDEGPDSRLVK